MNQKKNILFYIKLYLYVTIILYIIIIFKKHSAVYFINIISY